MVLVSIVVPLYNSRATLIDCLESVIKQTHPYLEIILVDDGSDEKYDDIINSFNDNRIEYYKLTHSNANVARNYGISKSKGEYVAMLDGDDTWLPNHLNDCLSTIKRENVDGLYGSLFIKNKATGYEKEGKVRALYKDETMIDYLLRTGYGAQTSSLFLSAKSTKTVKWDESLKRHQDYDFVIRYSQSYKMAPKIQPTVVYHVSNSSKNIDFNSCIKVIEKNKMDIDPFLYNQYNQNMLNLAQNKKAKNEIIRHYKKESVRNLEYVPYSQYILIQDPKNRWDQLIVRMIYILHIIRIILYSY